MREDPTVNPYFPLTADFTEDVKFIIDNNSLELEEGKGLACYYVEPEMSGPWMYVDTRLAQYEGDRPATPAAVSELSFIPYFKDFGYAFVYFRFLNVCAEKGEWINPYSCGVEIYFDDELYTFTKDMYDLGGLESTTRLPVLFNSSDFKGADAFNTDPQGSYVDIHFKDAAKEWNKMKVRVVYTDKDGVEHFSDFASLDHPIKLTVDNFRMTNGCDWIARGSDFSVSFDITCEDGIFNNPVAAVIFDEEGSQLTSFASEELQMKRGDNRTNVVISGNFRRGQSGKTYSCALAAYTNWADAELLTPEMLIFKIGDPTGVGTISSGQAASVEYFNMQGLGMGSYVTEPGLYIKVITFDNGSKKVEKKFVK